MARFAIALILVLVSMATSPPAMANDKLVRLAVPQALADSGLLKFMLPRFTLKTQVRFELLPDGAAADAALGATGTPVFTGAGQTWSLAVLSPDHPGTQKFRDWITSEIGQRAITGFQPDGQQAFTLPTAAVQETVELAFDGNVDIGKKLSRLHCGRCHVAAPEDKYNTIGSTPSFFLLRAMDDWSDRFESFYVLKPHPAFTQIEDVTEPFPIDRPSPIVPIEMTLEDLEAIVAYVSAIPPADLGAPLKTQ